MNSRRECAGRVHSNARWTDCSVTNVQMPLLELKEIQPASNKRHSMAPVIMAVAGAEIAGAIVLSALGASLIVCLVVVMAMALGMYALIFMT